MAIRLAQQQFFQPMGVFTALSVVTVLLLSLEWLKQQYINKNIQQFEQRVLNELQLTVSADSANLQLIVDDFRNAVVVSAEDKPLIEFIKGNVEEKSMIAYRFSRAARFYPYIERVKIIRRDGRELLRMDRQGNGSSILVDSTDGIDRSHYDYVSFAGTLKSDDIGLFVVEKSPNDVNHGEQLIRVIAPVVDGDMLLGYLILRVDLEELVGRGLRSRRSGVFDFQYLIYGMSGDVLFENALQKSKLDSIPKEVQPSHLIQQAKDSDAVILPDYLYRYVKLSFPNFITQKSINSGAILVAGFDRSLVGDQAYNVEFLNGLMPYLRVLIFILAGPIVFLLYVWRNFRKIQDLAAAAMQSTSALLVVDGEGTIVEANHSYCLRRGYDRESLVGKNSALLVDADGVSRLDSIKKLGVWTGEYLYPYSFPAERQGSTEILTIKAIEGSAYYICSFTDISEQKKLQRDLERLSLTDPLTNLPNRRAFDIQADRLNQQYKRYPERVFCLLIVDLDHFKKVNDVHGHDVGDQVLVSFAETLIPKLRSTDYLGRLGGEEFGIFLADTDTAAGLLVAERICEWIATNDSPIAVTCSIGLAQQQAGWNWTRLYKEADKALYKAKEGGRNRVAHCE